jgi:alpha-1,2-mannosyltransferase
MTEPRGSALATIVRVLPVVAIVSFVLVAGAVAIAAGPLLGYDFQAYVHAADRLLAGERLYDPNVSVAGGFAIYLYPPPFAVAFVPFALLPQAAAVGLWTVLLGAAIVAAALLMPVRREIRWLVVLLAAFDWPVLYSIKLGQVGPILLLFFAIGWRWMDRPAVLAASIIAGGVTKLQPIALAGWALLTGRVRAAAYVIGGLVALGLVSLVLLGPSTIADYVALLARVSAPVTTPHNFTPGAIAYQAGVPEAAASAVQLAAVVLAVGAALVAIRVADDEASYVVAVVATQLVSPLLWDHYAVLLLLPVALLLERGQWWAALLPLATALPVLGIVPAAVYPIEFVICLVAPIVVGRRRAIAAPAAAGRVSVATP